VCFFLIYPQLVVIDSLAMCFSHFLNLDLLACDIVLS